MMMSEYVTFLTPNGLKKIQQDLHELRTVRRPQAIKQLQETLEERTSLENPDYEVARDERAFIEGRIQQLEWILKNVVIIEKSHANEVIELGSLVTITEGEDGEPEQYFVVGSAEADPRHGYISNESPLGKALLGHKAGDQVVVEAPDGEIVFYIKAVE